MKNNDVVKVLKVQADIEGENLTLLKDLSGRIYFLDSHETGGCNIAVGDIIYGWVVSETDKCGYIRCTIDGVLINDYIKNIPNLSVHDYVDMETHMKEDKPDALFLSMQMFKSDYKYNKWLKEDAISHTMLKTSKSIDERYRKFGTSNDTEVAIHRKAIMDSYLYATYPTM